MPRPKRPSALSSEKHIDTLLQERLHSSEQTLHPIVFLWIMRLLIPLAGHRKFVGTSCYKHDELAHALGLQGGTVPPAGDDMLDDSKFDPRDAVATLRHMHAKTEQMAASLAVPSTLRANVDRLAEKLDLSVVERRILEFTVMLHSEQMLEEASDLLGGLSTRRVASVLAILLDLPAAEVKEALSSKGGLARCGLVTLDTQGFSQSLKGRLEAVSHRFVDRMLSDEQDPMQLIRDTVFLSRPATLARDNYPHAEKELSVLLPYLQHALAVRRTGVNVLVYGPPGTGKSELARMLAMTTSSELFEVASEDEDGDPVKGEQRLRSYKAAQSLLSSQRALLLFDEIEDVFNNGDFMGHRSTAQLRKAWINRMLEENPVPTLWLSNSVRCMDPAFLRRFDLVMKLDVPPRQERARIVRRYAGDLLDEATISRIASAESLLATIGPRGSILVWNASFELTRLRELAEATPEHASALQQLMARVVDLLAIARAHYYHPDMRGSWSIKTVLPTVAPELDYRALTVADGGMAQETFLTLLSPETPPDRAAQMRADLTAYCERDTLAMVELARFFERRRKASQQSGRASRASA